MFFSPFLIFLSCVFTLPGSPAAACQTAGGRAAGRRAAGPSEGAEAAVWRETEGQRAASGRPPVQTLPN